MYKDSQMDDIGNRIVGLFDIGCYCLYIQYPSTRKVLAVYISSDHQDLTPYSLWSMTMTIYI